MIVQLFAVVPTMVQNGTSSYLGTTLGGRINLPAVCNMLALASEILHYLARLWSYVHFVTFLKSSGRPSEKVTVKHAATDCLYRQ